MMYYSNSRLDCERVISKNAVGKEEYEFYLDSLKIIHHIPTVLDLPVNMATENIKMIQNLNQKDGGIKKRQRAVTAIAQMVLDYYRAYGTDLGPLLTNEHLIRKSRKSVDVFIPALKLIIEVNGKPHKDTVQKDNAKYKEYKEMGYYVMVVAPKSYGKLHCDCFVNASESVNGCGLSRIEMMSILKSLISIIEKKCQMQNGISPYVRANNILDNRDKDLRYRNLLYFLTDEEISKMYSVIRENQKSFKLDSKITKSSDLFMI